MSYRSGFIEENAIYVDGPHPATLEDKLFLLQCEVSTGRTGGPGGQHRNKVDTGVRIVHTPSGIEVRATERREQRVNRSRAIFRLRLKLATRIRTATSRDGHKPSAIWVQRRQGNKLPVSPTHQDYPSLVAEALDVIVARRYDVAGAAGLLGVSMSQLTRLVRHEKQAFAALNRGRESTGLHPLRS